jgi:glucokinase
MNLLVVDLGGSHASLALFTDGTPRASRRIELAGARGLEPLLPSLAEALGELAAGEGVSLSACAGLGFGFPGLVDAVRGRVLATNAKFSDAHALDLSRWSVESLGLPLRLENDARAALLGERAAGAARGFDDVVMMTLGTGIGGSAMMGGELLRGRHHQAGVLGGHMPVHFYGRRCTCGGVGCAEAEASTWALADLCGSWPGYERSTLAGLPTAPDYADLFRAAAQGDRVALQIRDRSLAIWGATAVALIHAYDPEVLLLGGGVMGSADAVLPVIQRHVHLHAWTPWGRVEVRAGELGDSAALHGLATLFP